MVSLQLAQVVGINLRVCNVKIAAAQRRLTSNDVDVLDAEQHDVDLADKVNGAAHYAVHSNTLMDGWSLGRAVPRRERVLGFAQGGGLAPEGDLQAKISTGLLNVSRKAADGKLLS